MKTSLNFPELTAMPFSFEYYLKPFLEIGQKICRLYTRIPGKEIMNIENVITTLLQIEYYRNSFMFERKDIALTLLNKLDEMTEHIRRQAEVGAKFMPFEKPNSQSPKYELYANDFVIGDNSISGSYDHHRISYLTHSHINFLSITDPAFTHYHYHFIKNIIKKSILISDTGEKYRIRFFQLIHEKIEQCRKQELKTLEQS